MVHMTGASAGTTNDGLCGAPIVDDDDDVGDGSVAGVFQLANIEKFLSPIVDEIIYRGWNL